MLYFAEKITIPLISRIDACSVLEIGASKGNNTAAITSVPDSRVTVIDPCVDADLAEAFGDRIVLMKGLSLDVLPRLSGSFDVIFIDGDHNWYTVFHELKLIEERDLLGADGVIFLHDISWPYGRRDMYYEPERIPKAHRQPYAQMGIIKGKSDLVTNAGTNSGHFNAMHEGGHRNGVLAAIEEFLKQSSNDYYFIKDRREFGLGILIRKSEKNSLGFALSVYWTIKRSAYLDPIIAWTRSYAYRVRSGRVAHRLRVLRNHVTGRG